MHAIDAFCEILGNMIHLHVLLAEMREFYESCSTLTSETWNTKLLLTSWWKSTLKTRERSFSKISCENWRFYKRQVLRAMELLPLSDTSAWFLPEGLENSWSSSELRTLRINQASNESGKYLAPIGASGNRSCICKAFFYWHICDVKLSV